MTFKHHWKRWRSSRFQKLLGFLKGAGCWLLLQNPSGGALAGRSFRESPGGSTNLLGSFGVKPNQTPRRARGYNRETEAVQGWQLKSFECRMFRVWKFTFVLEYNANSRMLSVMQWQLQLIRLRQHVSKWASCWPADTPPPSNPAPSHCVTSLELHHVCVICS